MLLEKISQGRECHCIPISIHKKVLDGGERKLFWKQKSDMSLGNEQRTCTGAQLSSLTHRVVWDLEGVTLLFLLQGGNMIWQPWKGSWKEDTVPYRVRRIDFPKYSFLTISNSESLPPSCRLSWDDESHTSYSSISNSGHIVAQNATSAELSRMPESSLID